MRWYRSGADVERRLPVLSTYLGHVHVADTYWYLSACPELMRAGGGASRTALGAIDHELDAQFPRRCCRASLLGD